MKVYKKLLLLAISLFVAQATIAQMSQNYNSIVLDYVRRNIESNNSVPWNFKSASYDIMPNGDYIVKLTITRTTTIRDTNGTYDPRVRGFVYIDDVINEENSYLVFIDRNGEPSTYMDAPTNHEFHYWQGNAWLIMNKHEEGSGSSHFEYHNNIACFSNKGDVRWKARDMRIYGWKVTNNTLYLAGKYHDSGRSVIRTVDLRTFESADKNGVCSGVPYNIDLGDEGLIISEYKTNGEFSSFVFPYAANDKQFQIDQVLKKYDLTKVSDQIALGERYLNGNVVEKDENKAVELFEKAVKQNSDIAMLKLAECYKNGVGVMQNNDNAFSMYEKAANMGNKEAMIALSEMYVKGEGTEKNLSRALFWKERLAFNGDIDAQKYVIAHQTIEYEKYNITASRVLDIALDSYKNKYYDWARFCFERAVSLGSKDAMLSLGYLLYLGEGFPKDCNKAVEYLSKIAEDDNRVDAQLLLAQIYFENKGVPHDINKEMYWLTKAADNGNAKAQMKLGNYYKYSTEVKNNKKLAYEMYEKAALQDNQDAIKEMVYCCASGYGTKKDKYLALYWFEKMNSDTQMNIANSFFTGDETKKNVDLSAMMYRSMLDKGNIKATKALALCYLDGLGVDKSIYIAYDLAMTVRNTTHDGSDGDIYYIEAKYLDSKYHTPNSMVVDSYKRAISYGCSRAITDLARYKSKYGLRDIDYGSTIGTGSGFAGQSTAIGTVSEAVPSAIVSKATSNTAVGAAVGTAVGAGAGALIGKHMDKVKAQAEAVQNAQVQSVTDANGLQAVQLTFILSSSSTVLNDAVKRSLMQLANLLDNNFMCDVAIRGLSQQRARSVINYLVGTLGVNAAQIHNTVGNDEAPNNRLEVYLYASQAMINAAEYGVLQ